MGLFWRVSESDRNHAVFTIRSLHSSSVAGVAAALSWSQRRTQRVLNEVAARHPNRIAYDRSAGLVRWLDPIPPPAPAPPAPPPRAERSIPVSPPTPMPQTPVKWGSENRCPSCHLPLTPSGTPGIWVCSHCGKLTGSPGASRAAPPVPEPLPTAEPSNAGPSPLSDRRSQEMLAAWVTSQPIPCPKCRTPLRHRGVGEYACPTCGQHVRFPREGSLTAAVAPPPPPRTAT
jgi:ribosomal protein L37AE/L43A